MAQSSYHEKHIKVALRMIGHEIMLAAQDTTSLILPVIESNGQYKIQFESEFEFRPEVLVATVDKVMSQTKLANEYIVEVLSCNSFDVVYSFEVAATKSEDIIPCKTRVQPKACYLLLLTLVDSSEQNNQWTKHATSQSSTTSNHANYWLLGIFVLVGVVVLLYWFKRKQKVTDPNFIHLGSYQFNRQNTTLLLDETQIELTSKEADLLFLLYRAINTTVERDVILNLVWGDEGDYVGRTLDVFISKLRKKLEMDPKIKIVNIRGVGYKLLVEV